MVLANSKNKRQWSYYHRQIKMKTQLTASSPPSSVDPSCCKTIQVFQNHKFIGIYGARTIFSAGKSPYIRSRTVCIHGSGQPYRQCTLLQSITGLRTTATSTAIKSITFKIHKTPPCYQITASLSCHHAWWTLARLQEGQEAANREQAWACVWGTAWAVQSGTVQISGCRPTNHALAANKMAAVYYVNLWRQQEHWGLSSCERTCTEHVRACTEKV